MTVSLRHKPPKGDESSLLRLPVVAEPRAAKDTSDDFRFSAAVASFGMLLRGDELGRSSKAVSWASTQALAREALGDDESCRRHRFVELVGRAGQLAGDQEVSTEPLACKAELPPILEPPSISDSPPPVWPDPESAQAERSPTADPHAERSDFDWATFGAWALEVLRLLPPLLALPLFIMALRRPRRWE
jgi:hypothetical protein